MSNMSHDPHRRPPRGYGGQESAMMGDPMQGPSYQHQPPIRRSQSAMLTSRVNAAQRGGFARRDGVNDGGYHGFSYHRTPDKRRTTSGRPTVDLYSTTSFYDEDDEEMRLRTRENCAYRANRIYDMIENKSGRFYQPVAKAIEEFEYAERDLPPDPVVKMFINEVRDDLRLYRYCCGYACMMIDATLIEVCYKGEEERIDRDEVFLLDIVFNNFTNILGMQFLYWLEHHPDAYALQGRLMDYTRSLIAPFEDKIEMFQSMVLTAAGKDGNIPFPWKKGALERIIQSGHCGASTYTEYMSYAGHRRPVDVVETSHQRRMYYHPNDVSPRIELSDWIRRQGEENLRREAEQRVRQSNVPYYDLGHTLPVNDNWRQPISSYRGLPPQEDDIAEEDYTPGGPYGALRNRNRVPQEPVYTAPSYEDDDEETTLVEDPREAGKYYVVSKRTGKPLSPKAKTVEPNPIDPFGYTTPAPAQRTVTGYVEDIGQILTSIPGSGLFTAHPEMFAAVAGKLKYTGLDAPYDRKGALSTGCLPVIEYNAGPGTYTYTNVFVGEENVKRVLSDPSELLPLYKGHKDAQAVIPSFVENVDDMSVLLAAAKEEAEKGVRPLTREPTVILANKPVKADSNMNTMNAVDQIGSLVNDKAKVEPDAVVVGIDGIYTEAIYDADISYKVLRDNLPMLFRDFELDMTLEAFVWKVNQGLKKIGSDELSRIVSNHLTNMTNRWLHESRLYNDDNTSDTCLIVDDILEDAKELIDYLDGLKDSATLRLLNNLHDDLFLSEHFPLFADLTRINMYKADTLKAIDDDILKEARREALNHSVFLHKEYIHITVRKVPPLALNGQVMVERSRSPELHWLLSEMPKRMKKHFKRPVSVIMSFGESDTCWTATWSGFSREKFGLRKLTFRAPLVLGVPESPCYVR